MSYYDSEDQGHEYDDSALDWLLPNPQRFWFSYNLLYHREQRKRIMANNRTTVYASGKIYWAKIVGDKALVSNYDGDAREWTYEFAPEDTSFLKSEGLLDRLKDKPDDKNPDKGDYLILRKPEFTKEGVKNEPIRIYDEEDQPWDNRLIGNGSDVDVKLSIVNYGKGKKKGIYTTAIRVTNLVPYETNEFGGMNKSEKSDKVRAKAASDKKAKSMELDDLDDDIPF